MLEKIKFGTDGWRGVIAKDYTFANVRRCTQGFASYLLDHGKKDEWVVVGYDKRFHSENFAVAAAEVLAGNGLRAYLTESATPTPVISFSVPRKQAVAAVNITASHNPPTDNGYKVRNQFGGAIDPDGLKEIEAHIPGDEAQVLSQPYAEAAAQQKIVRFDPVPEYLDHIQTLVDLGPIRDAGLKVLVDPMWGNGVGFFPHLFSGARTQIVEIHSERNPLFPEMKRPEPIRPNIDAGLLATVQTGSDVLIITDGDADRVGLGDEQGNFIDQLRAYALIAFYLLEVRGFRGPIVKTLSTTTMLDKLGRIYDVPVYHTGVGFKYVAPKMLETDAMVGGEESGGYAYHGHVPERDGILSGLFFLDMMVKFGKKPSELVDLLFSKVGAHYYDRIDTPFQGDRAAREQAILSAHPETLGGLKVTGLNTLDGYKFSLEDGGWMLIRFSGTEPILRIYTETTRQDCVAGILEDGLRVAGIK